MTGMFRSLDLFVLSCLFLTVISEAGEISSPQNFTLRWIDDFTPELSWTPQNPVRNCDYIVIIKPQMGEEIRRDINTSKWSEFKILGGRSMHFSVSDCNGNRNNAAVYEISYPELVKRVDCYYYAPQKTRCEWIPASDASELRFFYKLKDEVTYDRDKIWSELQECSSYSPDGVKTGCELQANDRHVIYISFNGTVNSNRSRNTFEIMLKDHVRPPAPKWTVVESKDRFNISWIAPDILESYWEYNIRHTECNEAKSPSTHKGVKTHLLRNSQCRYCIAIQAVLRTGGAGATPWSADKCFDKDKDKDLHALVFVTVFIPCVVAILAALMFVCCRRNKNKFWPKIITPVDLITDIDNNNKSNLYNLQAPAEEEQTCEITVLDPEIIKLDC